jgi:predicted SAM-dependent methyltransferase
MKIHLGCGLVYKKGYVNIDAYDDTVADKVMLAHKLEFEDNVASVIECIQMIEHLGAAKSIYALAEMFRILQPRGVLVIETPDLESAFQIFLKKGEEDRKYLMNWIFGLDSPGMLHRYCFPSELLNRMLSQAGFVDVKITRINTKSNQPTLRAICRKTEHSMVFQTMSTMRRKLVESGIVNLNDQVKALEQENLIQLIIKYAKEYQDSMSVDNLRKLVVESAVVCPDVGLAFFNASIIHELISTEKAKPHIETLQSFSELKMPSMLLHLLMNAPIEIGTQEQIYSSIRSMGIKAAKKSFSGKSEEVYRELRKTHSEIDSYPEFNVFSKVEVEQLAERTLALATKAFAENNLSEALYLYNQVLRFDRNNLKAVWNLARIEGLDGSIDNAEKYYEQAKGLARIFRLPIQRHIIKRLNSEMESLSKRDIKRLSEPLLEIY